MPHPVRPLPAAVLRPVPSSGPPEPVSGGRPTSPLWLAIRLPDLPLEVLLSGPPAGPVAVLQGDRILRADARARVDGIADGMPVGAARALDARLELRSRDPRAEASALERLAVWAGQFTPVVSLAAPEGLLLEVAGSLGLFGGAEALIEQVRRGLETQGFRACLALAPTPLAGLWLAAAGGGPMITDPGALPARLGGLPLAVLPLAPAQRRALEGMGLESVGDCLRLPRDGLARRLGPALVELLDRALGRRPDPRLQHRPPPRFADRWAFADPVTDRAVLLQLARRQLLALEGFLRARDEGIQTLSWTLGHRRAAATRLRLGLMRPGRDAGQLLELTRERLERTVLPEPVLSQELRAGESRPLAPDCGELFPVAGKGQDAWTALVQRLQARLGGQAVQGLRLVPDHRPERAWSVCLPGQDRSIAAAGASAGPAPAPRPLWLLAEPRALSTVDGRPQLDGPLHLERGRERIDSGWWDGERVRRDYFVARNRQGLRLWIYCEPGPPPRWFLHGLFG